MTVSEEEVGQIIVDAAIEVHRELGPGLFESVYEQILATELADRGLSVARQRAIPVHYKGRRFDEGFRVDLLVESRVVVEIKSIEILLRLHRKQVLTYLRLGNFHLGYLMNFNVPLLKDGMERLVNGWIE